MPHDKGDLLLSRRLKTGQRLEIHEYRLALFDGPRSKATGGFVNLKASWRELSADEQSTLIRMVWHLYLSGVEINETRKQPADPFEAELLRAAQKFVNDVQEAANGG